MGKHIHSTTVTVDVDVDIDTDDLSDEDLIEVCEQRGIVAGGFDSEVIDELLIHFKLGRHDAVLERVRTLVQDAKGVIL